MEGHTVTDDNPAGQINHHLALRPVTLRQISDATRIHSDAPLKIDGREVRTIVTVAMVVGESLVFNGRKARYELDDGTCQLVAWRNILSGQNPASAAPDGRFITNNEQCYARVVGLITVSRPGGRPSINVFNIRRVDSGNEVLHHYMEAMVATLSCTQGRAPVDIVQSARTKAAQDSDSAGINDTSHDYSGVFSQFSQYPTTPPPASRLGTQVPSSPTPTLGLAQSSQASGSSNTISSDSQHTSGGRRKTGVECAPSPSYTQNRTVRQDGGASRTHPTDSAANLYPISGSRSSRSQSSRTAARPSGSGSSTTRASPSPSVPDSSSSTLSSGTPSPPSPRDRAARSTSRLGQDPLSHLTGLQRQIIINIMNSESATERGVHVTTISRRLPNSERVDVGEISAALDSLLEQGLIEATDEDSLYYRAVETVGTYELPEI